MSTNYHTQIATGAAANAATFNAPLATLDAAITAAAVELAAARLPYADLDGRLDSLAISAGQVNTTANGTQTTSTTLLVSSGASIINGAWLAITTTAGEIEYRQVASGGGTNTVVLTAAHSGVTDGGLISMLPASIYEASIASNYGNGTIPTLADAISFSSQNIFNAAAYGALPAASAATNAAAIQAAIAAAAAAGGGIVLLPAADTYNCDPIDLDTGVFLSGATRLGTILTLDAASNDHLITANNISNCGVRRITLDGNQANQSNGSYDGIRIIDCDDVIIEDFSIINAKDCGIRIVGDAGDGSRRVWIQNGRIYNCGTNNTTSNVNAGVLVNDDSAGGPDSEQVFISNVIADTCGITYTGTQEGACFQVNNGDDVHFSNCEALNGGKYGWKLQGDRIHLNNCRVYNHVFHGISLQGGQITVNGARINGNSNANASGIVADASNTSGNLRAIVSDVEVEYCGNAGMEFKGSSTLKISQLIVTNFLVHHCDTYGLRLRGDVDGAIITNGLIYDIDDDFSSANGIGLQSAVNDAMSPTGCCISNVIVTGCNRGIVLADAPTAEQMIVSNLLSYGNNTYQWSSAMTKAIGTDNFLSKARTRIREFSSAPALSDMSEMEIAIGDGTEAAPTASSDAIYFKPDGSKIVVISSNGTNIATRWIT